jgi:hypothetical protein
MEDTMKTKNYRLHFKRGIAFAGVCLILCTPSLSLGWGPGGHMMVASVAFKRLNPRAKAKVQALLALPIQPTAQTNKTKDFVNAAHWADDIRDVAAFKKFAELHFIDTAFSVDGTALPPLPIPNVVTALQENVAILKNPASSKNAQAQALRFVIHFVGDIHQPLHCATRVDSAHPTGDQGGNGVLLNVGGKSVKLHSYWDGGINSFPKGGPGPTFAPPALSTIGPAAAKVLVGNPATDPNLNLNNPTNFDGWAAESFELAKSTAYDGMQNGVTPSATYNAAALKVARQRVAWGGYRLAALLNSIWP